MSGNIESDKFSAQWVEEARKVFFQIGADDTNNGMSPTTAVGTISQAIAIAQALVPPPSDTAPVVISSITGGKVSDNVVLPNDVGLDAPDIILQGADATPTITWGSGCFVTLKSLENNNAGGIALGMTDAVISSLNSFVIKADDSNSIVVNCEGSSRNITVNCEIMDFGGKGIVSTSNGTGQPGQYLTVDLDQMRATKPNAKGIEVDGTMPISVQADILDAFGNAGVTAVDCISGRIQAEIGAIVADVSLTTSGVAGVISATCTSIFGDIIANAGTTINATCAEPYSENVTENGTVNADLGGEPNRYGSFLVTAPGTVNLITWADYVANTPFDATKLYHHYGEITATDTTQLDFNGCTIEGVGGRSFAKLLSSQTGHKLIVTDQSFTMTGLYIEVDEATSQVFDVSGLTGFETVAIHGCSFNGNNDLGTIDNVLAVNDVDNVFQNNAGGITFNDVSKYSYNGSAWVSNNTATTNITFTGTMSTLLMPNIAMGVDSGKTGVSVAGVTVTDVGSIGGVFSGAGTYVDDETIFEGIEWSVEAVGVERIYKDSEAFGNVAKDGSTTTLISSTGVAVKITGASTYGENFRTSDDSGTDNRILNDAGHGKVFHFGGSVSVDNSGGGADNVSVYIAIDGTEVSSSRTSAQVGSFLGLTAIPINESVYVPSGSYGELWIANDDDTTNLVVFTYNYTAK